MRRIGFDAVRALRNSTGLGSYSRGVLRGLLGSPASVAGYLYSPEAPRPEYAALPAELGAPLRLPPARWRGPGSRTLWRTFRLGRAAQADGIELYHGLSHEIPRDLPHTGIPSVATFLDLIWHRFPNLFPPVDRWSYQWRYRWTAEHATALVAVSRQTRSDLIDCLGLDPARIVVVPPPGDPRFAEPVSRVRRDEVLRRYGLPERFLLSVGTLQPRKNQRTAIAALANLDPSRTPPLLLVGRDRGTQAELLSQAARLGVAERVRIRTDVVHQDLPALMQCAALFLYPSITEGFGIPIVEALSAGLPVIASEGGCFPEAGGPETLYFPATDATALAGLVRRVLDDPVLAERMRTAGRCHAASFSPERLTARLLEVYEAVLAGRSLPADEAAS